MSEDIYTNQNADEISKNFRTYVLHLIESVCKHCRLPADHVGPPPGKTSDFGEFRNKVSDLVSDIIFMVEANDCFKQLQQVMLSPTSNWVEIEASLFIMCAFAKSLST